MGNGRAERNRRPGRVIIAVVATLLLVAAGVGAVGLARVIAAIDLDDSGAGEEAASRIRTVVATGDVSPPPGGTLETHPQCDAGSGEPLLELVFTGPVDARQLEDLLEARWRSSGWDVGTPPFPGAPLPPNQW
jgi:hypothetical protein